MGKKKTQQTKPEAQAEHMESTVPDSGTWRIFPLGFKCFSESIYPSVNDAEVTMAAEVSIGSPQHFREKPTEILRGQWQHTAKCTWLLWIIIIIIISAQRLKPLETSDFLEI